MASNGSGGGLTGRIGQLVKKFVVYNSDGQATGIRWAAFFTSIIGASVAAIGTGLVAIPQAIASGAVELLEAPTSYVVAILDLILGYPARIVANVLTDLGLRFATAELLGFTIAIGVVGATLWVSSSVVGTALGGD